MEDHNTGYFRNLWQTTMSDLENFCTAWEKICSENEIPEEIHGEIRTTIGLARLLMNQKLKQFNGLIDDSENNTGEKEITCSDLQGFWDMVYFEVEKIKKCFCRLDSCKNNEWKFVEENSEKLPKKKVPVTKDATDISKKDDSSKSRALAAKQRLAEAKKRMLAQRKEKEENFVEVIPSSKQLVTVKKSNKKHKVSDIQEKVVPVETNESAEECLVASDVPTSKEDQQSHPVSIHDKENFLPTDDTSNPKIISATPKKSKIKTGSPQSGKSGRKKKEVKEMIKLQCVTRSAKKAMLAQQNKIQKS